MRALTLLLLALATAPAFAAPPARSTAKSPSAAPTPAPAPAPAATPPRIEVLLNQKIATQAAMGQPLPVLALTPDRAVLLTDATRTFAVGWGGVKSLGGLGLEAFAYTRDGLLMGVRGRQLMYLGADGKFKTLSGLPSTGMGISAGESARLFLFERNASGPSALYELLPQRRFRKLLESPQAITAVTESQGHVLFTAGNAVFALAPDKSVRALAVIPGKVPLRSLAASRSGKTLYLSDGKNVFALTNGAASVLLKETGGALLGDGDALLVLDPRSSLLLRIVNASP